MDKRKIKIKTTSEDEFGIRLTVGKRVITEHLEMETGAALQGLLHEFGHTDEEFEIKDER
jgi:hypothetical protein